MAKLTRQTVTAEALDLLDEVGLDAVSTRRLAQRLGVEQPSLYWHFRTKADLLGAMAQAAMAPHAAAPLPARGEDWYAWYCENSRSFRRTLLARRDGARLHAGTRPGPADFERLIHKLAFLVTSGLPERDAQMMMLAASRFTVGSVLEEQADGQLDKSSSDGTDRASGFPTIDHGSAFEAGLAMIVNGLAHLQGHQ